MSSRAIGPIFVLVFGTILSIGCVRRERQVTIVQQANNNESESAERININTATREELERLPGIGPGLATRIIEYRERHGAFRRPEHLILVRGFSDRKFRAIRETVTTQVH